MKQIAKALTHGTEIVIYESENGIEIQARFGVRMTECVRTGRNAFEIKLSPIVERSLVNENTLTPKEVNEKTNKLNESNQKESR